MDTFVVVEKFTQVLTVIALASGIPPCLHMIRTGITKNVPYIFFFFGMMNGAVGTVYGTLVSNDTILYINLLSVLLNAVCVISYISVVSSKRSPLLQLIGGIGLLLANHLYCSSMVDDLNTTTEIYGVWVFVLSLFLLASPALEVMECVKDKSAAGMSLVMLSCNLSCSLAWAFYGLLLKDFFIYGPNFIGVATNLGKAVARVVYGDGRPKKE